MLVGMEDNSRLAAFVKTEMEKQNLSTSEVARRTKFQLSAGAVAKIVNGETSSSTARTLTLLAEGLGVEPIDVLRIAAGIENSGEPMRFEIYAERFDAADLSKSEWEYLESFFKGQVDFYREQRARLDAGEFVRPETETKEKGKRKK